MRDALNNGLSTVASFVPRLLLFLVILVVGVFVAKAIGKALSAILERVGFDRAVERGGVKKALANSKYDASDIVSKIIYYALLLFVLQLAFGVFPANPISELLASVIAFLPNLVVAIVIVVVAAAIAAAVRELIANTIGGLSYGKTLANIASVFILGFGVIAALNQIGVATAVTTPVLITVLATIGGVLVVGVGGGLVGPMSKRWEGYLSKAEAEAPKIREHAANAPSAREQAAQARDQARDAYQDDQQQHDQQRDQQQGADAQYPPAQGQQGGYYPQGQDQRGGYYPPVQGQGPYYPPAQGQQGGYYPPTQGQGPYYPPAQDEQSPYYPPTEGEGGGQGPGRR